MQNIMTPQIKSLLEELAAFPEWADEAAFYTAQLSGQEYEGVWEYDDVIAELEKDAVCNLSAPAHYHLERARICSEILAILNEPTPDNIKSAPQYMSYAQFREMSQDDAIEMLGITPSADTYIYLAELDEESSAEGIGYLEAIEKNDRQSLPDDELAGGYYYKKSTPHKGGRTARVDLRLTPDELALLDQGRGDESRSDFIMRLVRNSR